MAFVRAQYRHFAQDAVANRVYQAFERLQFAWYTLSARRSDNNPSQFDEAAVIELKAAEEEWSAARSAVNI